MDHGDCTRQMAKELRLDWVRPYENNAGWPHDYSHAPFDPSKLGFTSPPVPRSLGKSIGPPKYITHMASFTGKSSAREAPHLVIDPRLPDPTNSPLISTQIPANGIIVSMPGSNHVAGAGRLTIGDIGVKARNRQE